MELLTSKQIEELTAKYPLYSQDGKGIDAIASYKFFLPGTGATWYLTEASREGQGVTCFGVCIVTDPRGELGYFSLDELQGLKFRGVQVERDKYFTPAPLRQLRATEPALTEFLDIWEAHEKSRKDDDQETSNQ